MSATIMDGVAVAKVIRAEWKQRVALLKEQGITPRTRGHPGR